jgi:hypothetical protein
MTKERHDPCLLDTFVAAVRFMGSEPARPWWAYTAECKRALKARKNRRRRQPADAGRSPDDSSRGRLITTDIPMRVRG